MSGKRTRSFKIAVHRRDERDIWQPRAGGNCCQRHGTLSAATTPGRGYGCGSLSSAAADECEEGSSGASPWRRPGGGGVSLFGSMVRAIATEFLPDGRDRKYYADHYTCRPPPLFVFVVTLIELGFFTYYTVTTGAVTPTGPVPIDSFFIYRPDKRLQVWRFVFYMVLHAGWIHLLFNLLVQMLVGLPLEMVHGSLRIGTVYMAGVLAGSLGTSVFDTDVYLVGASGGVYALLAAHLANVLLNYNQMQFGLVRLVGVFVIASADVGFAVYDRYAAEPHGPPVSYVAHLTGALAGLTIGLLVLKNFEQKLHEQLLWWVALGVYAACTLFAVLFNIFNY
ncbi:protein rhomboid-like isoform X1 [Haemaphysalis longicornis]